MSPTTSIPVPKAEVLQRSRGSRWETEVSRKVEQAPDQLPAQELASWGLDIVESLGSTSREVEVGIELLEELQKAPESSAAARMGLAMLESARDHGFTQSRIVQEVLENPIAQRPSEVVDMARELIEVGPVGAKGALSVLYFDFFPEDQELQQLRRFPGAQVSTDQAMRVLARLHSEAMAVESVYDMTQDHPDGVQVEFGDEWIVVGDVELQRS